MTARKSQPPSDDEAVSLPPDDSARQEDLSAPVDYEGSQEPTVPIDPDPDAPEDPDDPTGPRFPGDPNTYIDPENPIKGGY